MPTTTTTTTTPQPTGVHTFQCWDYEIPRVYPLIHPWPCCGLNHHPSTITGTVTYTEVGNGNFCGGRKGTYDATWSILSKEGNCPSDQFYTYTALDSPTQIFFTYPCWTASEFYGSKGLFGFSAGGFFSVDTDLPAVANGCNYDAKSKSWKFSGGVNLAHWVGNVNGNRVGCKVQIRITGMG